MCPASVVVLGAPCVRATTVLAPDFSRLVRTTDTVVRAEVVAIESRWEPRGQHRTIVTLATLAVRETLKGAARDEPLTPRLLGGTVGSTTLDATAQARFAMANRDFLIVSGNRQQWSPPLTVVTPS